MKKKVVLCNYGKYGILFDSIQEAEEAAKKCEDYDNLMVALKEILTIWPAEPESDARDIANMMEGVASRAIAQAEGRT